jgi:hypothetical protein
MKKLHLDRETVRNLTGADLDVVAGGKPGDPCNDTVPTEWPTCETCDSCDPCVTSPSGCTCETVVPPCTSGARICICNASR